MLNIKTISMLRPGLSNGQILEWPLNCCTTFTLFSLNSFGSTEMGNKVKEHRKSYINLSVDYYNSLVYSTFGCERH